MEAQGQTRAKGLIGTWRADFKGATVQVEEDRTVGVAQLVGANPQRPSSAERSVLGVGPYGQRPKERRLGRRPAILDAIVIGQAVTTA
jgi:hypothetical protein